MSSPVTGPGLAAIAAAVESEQLAAFGYGSLGPRLSIAAQVALARDCEQAHRDLAGRAMLLDVGVAPPSTAAADGFALPLIAVDGPTAISLAIELEQACASAWRFVLAQLTGPPDASSPWSVAVGALTDSAVRAVRWRRYRDPQSASVAFPGI
jgi:Domain of unknown function (DUF4439)